MEPNSIKYVSEDSIESFSNFESYNDDQDNISNISISDMLKIFNPIEDETDEIIPSPMPTRSRSNLFITTKDTTELRNKKRGRQTNLKEGNKKHDKFSSDNIIRKIHVHFVTFIIFFIDDILSSFGIREKFYKLDYEIIKDVNKQKLTELKNKNIGEIISNKISTKYKKDENTNINLYEHLKSNETFGKIFSMNYMTFFKMFFMKNEKTIDLRIFGIEKEITLSKETKTYDEFLAKQKDEKYIKKIKEILNKNYLKKKKFVLY
jgi:hypothetical protein